MKLSKLLRPWLQLNRSDCDIEGLHNDSRLLKAGDLFIAYPGTATDGRLFISQALEAKVAAIVYEPTAWPANAISPDDFNGVPFPGVASQLAGIASRFYEEPTRHLSVTGITGTNGKTTIAYQLAQAHALLGTPAAYIGTLGQGTPSQLTPLANTTPDALALQSLCHQYRQEKIQAVCMEVSSHALAQHRVDYIEFKQAIFTNLTLDHLDYHKTMSAYAAAKAVLFANRSLDYAIINGDDDYASMMIAKIKPPCRLLTYGIKEDFDFRARSWDVSLDGTEISVQSPWGVDKIHINALGFFNIYNALAIFASLYGAGYSRLDVVDVMKALKPAPGRMEVVLQQPYVIVDYAHTPDALENVLATLNKVKKAKIIVVFGCGGDRDKSKRPLMGKIAAQWADMVIITSDNPRSEDPLKIMDDIEQGLGSNKPHLKIADRQKAIAKALSLAKDGDMIVVAGKGHENYQQIGQTRHHFSDREVILSLL